ncbi:MAG: hypothetical protein ACO27U_01900 [Ilumatobacteraceae bacterium]
MSSFLRSRSLRRGFLGSSRAWFAVGVVVWGSRLAKRILGRRPEVVSVERIEPGRSMIVSSVERSGRRRP